MKQEKRVSEVKKSVRFGSLDFRESPIGEFMRSEDDRSGREGVMIMWRGRVRDSVPKSGTESRRTMGLWWCALRWLVGGCGCEREDDT